MFFRRKKNKSGSISVQIIDKSSGKYRVVNTIGSSKDELEVRRLENEARKWMANFTGQLELDFSSEKKSIEDTLEKVNELVLCGTSLLLDPIFDEIGFNQIPSLLFRELVKARISAPSSKLKTTSYWRKYRKKEIDVAVIYRYMDRLNKAHKSQIQQISFIHTQKVLGGQVKMLFYDVTTLYFETDKEDLLRKTGFSKDGKHQHPQILLGLLVSTGGYPLAYDIFEGNHYEGYTMLPVIKSFKERYAIEQLTVVADSGLMSKKNIAALEKEGFSYILGARIKNETQSIKNKILSLQLTDGQASKIAKGAGEYIVVQYTQKRAKKDAHNRKRGLDRLKKKITSGKLTKTHINNRGYNKCLKLTGEIAIDLDEQKVGEEQKWDGLKGYVTNTTLSIEDVISNYHELWKIEKAFRVVKNDLNIRPIFHRLKHRIEAHICIAFSAYKLHKEVERKIKEMQSKRSVEQVIEIAKTIYKIQITMSNGQTVDKVLLLNNEQKELAQLLDWKV